MRDVLPKPPRGLSPHTRDVRGERANKRDTKVVQCSAYVETERFEVMKVNGLVWQKMSYAT